MNTINQGTYKPLGIIKSNLIPLTILLTFGLLLFACNENHNPVSETSISEHINLPETANTGVNTEPVDILGFEIKFIDTVYNNGQTTFNYRVTRGENASGFNYLFFETPECAIDEFELVGFSPENGSPNSIVNGNTGIKWTSSIGSGSSRDYSITYSGNQSTGMTYATIQGTGSSGIETKPIPGPCKGIYTISGHAYVDENGNSNKDSGESGIGNVVVRISNGNATDDGNTTQTTSSDGSYTFNVFTGGEPTDFTLEVLNDDNKHFPTLFDNFEPTEVPKNEGENQEDNVVTVGDANVSGKNFGFKPDTDGIIRKFENPDDEGGIKLRTETPKFWANQFKFATKNRDMVFGKDDLRKFLKFELINELELTYTFNFKDHPDDNDLKKAEQILTLRGNSTDFEKLRAELLAAMLNVESGNGAVEEINGEVKPLKDFNSLILKIGAAAAVAQSNNGSSLMMNSTTHETTTFTITSQSLSSGNLLRSFNGGGGGVGN